MMSQEQSQPEMPKLDYSEQLKAYAKGMLVSFLWSGMGWLDSEANSQSPPEVQPDGERPPETPSES